MKNTEKQHNPKTMKNSKAYNILNLTHLACFLPNDAVLVHQPTAEGVQDIVCGSGRTRGTIPEGIPYGEVWMLVENLTKISIVLEKVLFKYFSSLFFHLFWINILNFTKNIKFVSGPLL